MLRIIHTVNRKMNTLQKKQENISANMANLNTPGYKFQDIIESTLGSNEMVNHAGGHRLEQRQVLGDFSFGNEIDGMYRNFQQGNLLETYKSTDFAIVGNGFFMVEMTNGGIGFTRNGNFKLNEENQLVTMDGHYVLGMDNNGNPTLIYGENDNVNLYDIAITDFNNYEGLNNIGESLFTSNEAGYYLEDTDLRQGSLEMSNIQIADELVKLMGISREFESAQKLLHAADDTLNKAVNEIGRV